MWLQADGNGFCLNGRANLGPTTPDYALMATGLLLAKLQRSSICCKNGWLDAAA